VGHVPVVRESQARAWVRETGQGRPRVDAAPRGAPRAWHALTVHTCTLSSAVYRMLVLPCNGCSFSVVASASACGPMGPVGGEPTGRTAACRVRKSIRVRRRRSVRHGWGLGQAMRPSRPVPVSCPMRRLQGPPGLFADTRSSLVRPPDARTAPVPHEACGQQMRAWLASRMSAQCSALPGVRQTDRFAGLKGDGPRMPTWGVGLGTAQPPAGARPSALIPGRWG